MADREKLKNEIRETILEYVKQYLNRNTEDNTETAAELGVNLAAAGIANKENERVENSVLLQADDGTNLTISAKEPEAAYIYHISQVNQDWAQPGWWRQVTRSPGELADMVLAVAKEYLLACPTQNAGEGLTKLRENQSFADVNEALTYCAAQLRKQPLGNALAGQLAEVLQALERQLLAEFA